MMDIQQARFIIENGGLLSKHTALFLIESLEKAEAQLAELAAQEPVAWLVLNSSEGYVERNPDVVAFLEAAGLTKCKPLFTRAVPPAPITLPCINHPAQFDYADKVVEILKVNGLKVVGHEDE